MLSDQFLEKRAADLCQFFRGKFGSRWRMRAQQIVGPATWFDPVPSRDCGERKAQNVFGCAPKSFRAAERWAIANGFDASILSYTIPFERNRLRQFGTVLESLGRVCLNESLRCQLNVENIVKEFVQHKKRHRATKSDVIPPQFLTICPSEQRIVYPITRETFDQISFESLMRQPIDLDPAAATGTGGHFGPPFSLSGSRAEIKVTRAEPSQQLEFAFS